MVQAAFRISLSTDLSFLPVRFDEKGQPGSHALLKLDTTTISLTCTAFTDYLPVA
jgi:hypothetical protein